MAFQVNIPNEDAWAKEIAGSQTGVVQGLSRYALGQYARGDPRMAPRQLICIDTCCCAVVEVYQDWCGPCKAVINTLKKQFFELGERPLKFYTVSMLSSV